MKKKWTLLAVLLGVLLYLTACASKDSPEMEKKEFFLENGYYTVGTDIPAGTCDMNVTSGVGNILYSADGTIDTYSAFDDDLNQALTMEASNEDIENYTLKDGYTIHISGPVRVQLKYSKITGSYTGRTYDEKNKITLKSGTYTAGKDFEAGIYTITAIEGNGNLSSSNAFSLGVDELFGVFDGTETYVPKAVNITLNEGDTLEVTDITIEMIKANP